MVISKSKILHHGYGGETLILCFMAGGETLILCFMAGGETLILCFMAVEVGCMIWLSIGVN